MPAYPGLPPRIRLTYFDIPGPVEAVRLAFYISGIDFEDERVSREEFSLLKPELPTGQLPILTVEGVVCPQIAAILRYAGKIGGLYPTDALTAAKCDAVVDIMFDIQAAIRPSIYERDPKRKLKMRRELANATLPMWLGHLERWLQQCGTTFFAGDDITICDLVIYSGMKWLCRGVLSGIPGDILDQFPNLCVHSAAIDKHPKVHEYYASANERNAGHGHGSPRLPSS